MATTASASIAVSVPSDVAPSRIVCVVAPRRPPSSCSACRSLTSRTGRPVIRASSAAASASKPAPCLAPKPPPTNSTRTRTSSLRSPKAPASSSRRGEHPLRRDPGGDPVAVPGDHRAVRLERRLQLGRRLELELDRHLGGRERRLGVAACVVGRLGREALLVDGLLRVDHVGQHLDVELRAPARRPTPPPACRPRRPRSAGRHTPARTRGWGSRRQRELALRPDHGPDAVRRTGGVEVERSHAPVRDGRAQHRRVEHARETDVGRVADATRRAQLPVQPRAPGAPRARAPPRAASSRRRRPRRRAPRRPRSAPPSPSAS